VNGFCFPANAKPVASPFAGYGYGLTITTLTSLNGHKSKDLNISFRCGVNGCPAWWSLINWLIPKSNPSVLKTGKSILVQDVLLYLTDRLFIVALTLSEFVMSDNLEVKKFPTLDKSAVIKLEIYGDYYISLKSVFSNFLAEGESKESVGVILNNLSNKKITSLKEHRLYLMYVLLIGIENSAREQGVLVDKTVDEVIPKDSQD